MQVAAQRLHQNRHQRRDFPAGLKGRNKMLETKIRLKVGNLSDIGKVRESNQDYYGKYEGQFGTLYIVCDGMGGHAGGDKASRLAVDKIRESFFQLTSPLTRPLGRSWQTVSCMPTTR